MNLRATRLALICTSLVGLGVTLRVAAWPLASIDLGTNAERPAPTLPVDSTVTVSQGSVGAIISRDLFRIDRRPVLPAYDPLRLAEQSSLPVLRPMLTLVGLVTSTEPSAVIEGLPGVQGSQVLRVGDMVSGLQLKQISKGRVVIVGLDTTWVLEVREPWKP